jgi:hypothetical protein
MTLSIFLMGTFYYTIIVGLTELKNNTCIAMCSEEASESNEAGSTTTNNILEEEIKHKETCIKDYSDLLDYHTGIILHLVDRENLDHQHHIPSVPTPPPDFC